MATLIVLLGRPLDRLGEPAAIADEARLEYPGLPLYGPAWPRRPAPHWQWGPGPRLRFRCSARLRSPAGRSGPAPLHVLLPVVGAVALVAFVLLALGFGAVLLSVPAPAP